MRGRIYLLHVIFGYLVCDLLALAVENSTAHVLHNSDLIEVKRTWHFFHILRWLIFNVALFLCNVFFDC